VLLLAVLTLYTADKLRTNLAPELLWGCPVAALLLAAGLLAKRPRLTAVAAVFHLAIGLPAYAVFVIATGTVEGSSVLLHLSAPLVGTVALWRGAYPARSALYAWAIYLALLPVSYVATPAALNVNLAHAPFAPPFGLASAWASWLLNGLGTGLSLVITDFAVRRARAWRPAPHLAAEMPRGR
jgi:hypothetical protein